jgi:hypothetical protein
MWIARTADDLGRELRHLMVISPCDAVACVKQRLDEVVDVSALHSLDMEDRMDAQVVYVVPFNATLLEQPADSLLVLLERFLVIAARRTCLDPLAVDDRVLGSAKPCPGCGDRL